MHISQESRYLFYESTNYCGLYPGSFCDLQVFPPQSPRLCRNNRPEWITAAIRKPSTSPSSSLNQVYMGKPCLPGIVGKDSQTRQTWRCYKGFRTLILQPWSQICTTQPVSFWCFAVVSIFWVGKPHGWVLFSSPVQRSPCGLQSLIAPLFK